MQSSLNKVKFIVLYFFCIFPFLSIAGLKDNLNNNIVISWQLMGFMVFVVLLTLLIKTNGLLIDNFVMCFIIYQVVAFVVTVLNRGFNLGQFFTSVFGILITLLIQYDGDNIVESLSVVMVASTFINFVLMIIYPVTQEKNYFLGGKNQLSIFLIPTIFLLLINTLNKGKKPGIFECLFILLCIATVIVGGSATGTIVIFAAVLLLVFSKFIKTKAPIVTALLSLNALLLCFNLVLSKNKFWIQLTSLLGKSSTLTGRTKIWAKVLQNIKSHWLFGNGKGVEMTLDSNYGIQFHYTEAHNIILEILVTAGIIGLIIFAYYIYLGVKGLDLNVKQQNYMFLAVTLYFINGLTESVCNLALFTIVIALAHYYSTKGNSKSLYFKGAKIET